jgi:hypothetical protein
MAATSTTRSYTARTTSLLDKIRPSVENQFTTSNAVFFQLKKKGMWKKEAPTMDRYRVPIMNGKSPVDTSPADGISQLSTTPQDGVTAAFYDWRRLHGTVVVGDWEVRQNGASVNKIIKTKLEQTLASMEEAAGQWFLQGVGADDGSSIQSPRASTSLINGASTFVDPLFRFIAKDPTTSLTIGDINQSTDTLWRNQALDLSAAPYSTNFAGLLSGVDHLINLCAKSAGGSPDMFIADLLGYEAIARALRAAQRYVDYTEVDFPWRAMRLNGGPFVFDQYVPDVSTPTTTVAAGSKSTLGAINTKFMGFTVDPEQNFTAGDYVRAPGATGEVSIVTLALVNWVTRRDKHGVGYGLKNDLTS